jgi:hypothetical protein
MKVLVIFANPPGNTPLRLDKEDRVITRVCRNFEGSVSLVRQHASEIDDIQSVSPRCGIVSTPKWPKRNRAG